jgi:hypothetical protein
MAKLLFLLCLVLCLFGYIFAEKNKTDPIIAEESVIETHHDLQAAAGGHYGGHDGGHEDYEGGKKMYGYNGGYNMGSKKYGKDSWGKDNSDWGKSKHDKYDKKKKWGKS